MTNQQFCEAHAPDMLAQQSEEEARVFKQAHDEELMAIINLVMATLRPALLKSQHLCPAHSIKILRGIANILEEAGNKSEEVQ